MRSFRKTLTMRAAERVAFVNLPPEVDAALRASGFERGSAS